MSLDTARRSSPYINTFFNLFTRAQYQDVLETVLILGIQTAQHGSKKPKLAELKSLVQVNTALTFTQNEFVPQAKQAMEKFKEKINFLELQLDQAMQPFKAEPNPNSLKAKQEVSGLSLSKKSPKKKSTEDLQQSVSPNRSVTVSTSTGDVRISFVNENEATVKSNPAVVSRIPSGVVPAKSFANYPAWWGHQEAPAALKKSPIKAKTDPTLKNKNRRASAVEYTKPWTFPKRMVDESIQTTSYMTREDLKRIEDDEKKDHELRLAARRQGPMFEAAPSRMEVEAELTELHIPQKSTPSTQKRHLYKGTQSEPPRTRAPISMSFSPPGSPTRRNRSFVAVDKENDVPQQNTSMTFSETDLSFSNLNRKAWANVLSELDNMEQSDLEVLKIARDLVNSDFIGCLDEEQVST